MAVKVLLAEGARCPPRRVAAGSLGRPRIPAPPGGLLLCPTRCTDGNPWDDPREPSKQHPGNRPGIRADGAGRRGPRGTVEAGGSVTNQVPLSPREIKGLSSPAPEVPCPEATFDGFVPVSNSGWAGPFSLPGDGRGSCLEPPALRARRHERAVADYLRGQGYSVERGFSWPGWQSGSGARLLRPRPVLGLRSGSHPPAPRRSVRPGHRRRRRGGAARESLQGLAVSRSLGTSARRDLPHPPGRWDNRVDRRENKGGAAS